MTESNFIQDTKFRPEKYCAVLAVYGKELERGNPTPVFDSRSLDNSVGRDVSGVLDIMEATGYLERVYVEEDDEYIHRLPESDDVRNEARDISRHVEEQYDGRIYAFMEDFAEGDLEELRELEVGLVN